MRVEYDKQTDDWLLQQYVLSRNQEAFAVLVRRYGPMVWGVCRRIVRHTQDAEDAFQATFAVLARKSRSIRRRRMIGSWLHQVARRIALRARATSNRRELAMPVVVTETIAEAVASQATSDHAEVLDDEIARLPAILRVPIILCYLEGLTNREAAERLGCPEGTIVSRLARGRDKLRLGLTRRGVVLGGTAAIATLLSEAGSAAPLLPGLSQSALACGLLPATGAISGGAILSVGAARLATEALQTLARRTLIGYAMLVACCAVGIAAFAGLALSLGLPLGGRLVNNDALGEGANRGVRRPALSLERIWQGEDLEFVGGATAAEHAALSQDCRWVVDGQSIRFKWQDVTMFSADFRIDSSRQPYAIDVQSGDSPAIPEGSVSRGAFLLNGIALEVCTAHADGERPEFVRAGIVTPPAPDRPAVRAGLVGYSRLRRLNRSFEADDLQGKWVIERLEAGGEEMPLDAQTRQGANFDNGTYTISLVVGGNASEMSGTFVLDPARPARFLKMRPTGGQSFLCLYEIEGDTLRLAVAAPGAARPEKFKTEPGQLHMSWVLRRAKPPGPDGSAPRPP
jgi:RNA polymerase sigma factor (sigma-70 family)